MRFTKCIVQVGMRLFKNKKKKMCNIEANVEYFAFLHCPAFPHLFKNRDHYQISQKFCETRPEL